MESSTFWWEENGWAGVKAGGIAAVVTLAPEASSFLVLLLGADLFLLLAHLLHLNTPFFADPGYSLNAERGFAGVLMTVKEFWLTMILGWLFLHSRRALFLAWGLLYGYLAVDDWFSVHERMGGLLGERLGLYSAIGLRVQDFGELLFSGAVGAVLIGALALAHVRSSTGLRRVGMRLAALLLALVAFGIAADMLHSLLMGSSLDSALLLVEEGGELLVMSLTCGYAYAVLQRRPGRRRQDLLEAR